MARGKQSQKSSDSTKQSIQQSKTKQNAVNTKNTPASSQEKNWEDPKFNGEELTMTQLKDMIQTLAKKLYEEKFYDLQEEMVEQVEYRVTVQCEGMEESIKSLSKQVSELKAEKQALNTTVDNLKETTKKRDRAIERLQWDNQCRIEENENLRIKLDQLEQYRYEKNLRIVGMPDTESTEDDEKKNIVKFAKDVLKLKLKTNDITEIQRMGKKSTTKPSRDLIVKFKKKATCDSFYKERKRTPESTSPKVYINEHITSYRSNLFYAARKLVKSKKLHSAWSQHGNILIRKDESDQPKQIYSHKDLAVFHENDPEDDIVDNSDEDTSDGEDSD